MALTVIKNWDNKTWLSSKDYIESFNKFLLKQIKLDRGSKTLDIGCGRGKITGNLSSKLMLINKPLGIDLTLHKDKDKRIKFEKANALTFLFKNKKKFDLILIKQTIHLFSFKEITKLLNLSKKNLKKGGKIIILSLDTEKNELPTFKLMKIKLKQSLKRDKKILKLITKLYPYKKNRFNFNVKILKNKYLKMIQQRYISTLLPMTNSQIKKGLDEIKYKYKSYIKFKDKLICLTL